jgi:archaellum component FlaC
MENIAVGAKVDLYKQGDQLQKIGDNINEIDNDLNVSHKTMDQIK